MKRTDSLSELWDLRAWQWNHWMRMNGGTLLYLLLTVAIGLQQFEATEPLTFGVWWGTLLFAFLGTAPFWDADWKSLVSQAVSTAAGIVVQVVIVVFFWEQLRAFDLFLHAIREGFARLLTGGLYGHLFFGHLIWLLCTAGFLYRIRSEGYLYAHFRAKPAYDIRVRTLSMAERAMRRIGGMFDYVFLSLAALRRRLRGNDADLYTL